ncbi:nucleotidyl transferase AbiEii/AbiGii toxin family protein [Caldicellulosiruptor acetigenus]|uniref:nucleotidyl transferase AbiEii/AbiGii toxin family protein n=1 Tax=Caldicellulosiruptor acetigenus TaxID=301953 RepID=UPI001427BF2E|nr:nucleotidyl transferase AbiEii/AbiGii toxin family protein [Caldicellulosiruptor acetigenus]WAM36940.1 nucleotidyl transferase AbiEii/AbiGii toxin family protein [Caldicellulosiruptor acetigenus]
MDSAKITDSEWTFGGDTALALYFQHRESKDIDIFLTDAQYLPFLSPRLNKAAKKIVNDYTEASNFVKLRFPKGEVNFIIAPHLTKNYYCIKEINGRQICIETPEEIITKNFLQG